MTAPRSTGRFVYLILSHGSCEQVMHLCEVLRAGSPTAAIILHHDTKYRAPSADWLDSVDVQLLRPAIDVRWGEMSQVDAVVAGLRAAVRIDGGFDWLVLLSGQCYPLKRLADIETEVRNGGFDAYVRATPVSDEHYGYRYFMQYWPLPRFDLWLPWRLRRSVLSWLSPLQRGHRIRLLIAPRGGRWRIGIRVSKNPFGADFVCHKGSTWFTASSRAVFGVLAFLDRHPEVSRYYRKTAIPDESLFVTILLNQHALKVSHDNRRFISWDLKHPAHPEILTMEHLDKIRNSNCDFGRKFDPQHSGELLSHLDTEVLS